MLKVEIEKKLPGSKNLWQVFASIAFWNDEGPKVYEQNRAGVLGSKRSQEAARKFTYQEFVFDCLFEDINTLATGSDPNYWEPGYKFGKAGSHIWVSNPANERVLFIHF